MYEIIGLLAFFLSFIYRIPQIYKSYKTKSVKDISMWTIFIQNFSYVLYIVYGVLIEEIVHVVSSAVGFVQNCLIVWMYYRYLPVESQPLPESDQNLSTIV